MTAREPEARGHKASTSLFTGSVEQAGLAEHLMHMYDTLYIRLLYIHICVRNCELIHISELVNLIYRVCLSGLGFCARWRGLQRLAVFRTFKFRHVVKFAILSAVIGRQDGYAVCDWLKAQTWWNLTLSGCGVSHVTVNVIDVNKMA